MKVYEAAIKRRTIRKFSQKKIENETLLKFIDAARVSPSAANMQPVKYIIVNDDEIVKELFPFVKWAGYITPNGNPQKGEEPTAYIVILADTNVRKAGSEYDIGAAAQTIILCAQEEGIGSCWMQAIDKDKIRSLLNVDGQYEVNSVLSLGYPAEAPLAEDETGSIKYYKDENGTLHVPKRRREDVLINIF